MKSRALSSFWDAYHGLPPEVQKLALKQYQLWIKDPQHPSIHFKKVKSHWSARVSQDYRAVGIMDGDTVIWYFIGTHAEYNRLLKQDRANQCFQRADSYRQPVRSHRGKARSQFFGAATPLQHQTFVATFAETAPA